MKRQKILQTVYVGSIFLGWGFSTFIMGFTGKYVPYPTALFCNMLGMVIVNAFFVNSLQWAITPYHFVAVLAGVLITVADLGYYKLADSGMDVSIVGPISSLYILVPALLGVVILKEPLSSRKVIGVLLALLAMYFLSTSDNSPHVPSKEALVRKPEDA